MTNNYTYIHQNIFYAPTSVVGVYRKALIIVNSSIYEIESLYYVQTISSLNLLFPLLKYSQFCVPY